MDPLAVALVRHSVTVLSVTEPYRGLWFEGTSGSVRQSRAQQGLVSLISKISTGPV